MRCRNCGQKLEDSATYCINCGTRVDYNHHDSDDRSTLGFAILGFFIPIVGLIIFLVYEAKMPKRAKSAGKGALIGFLTRIIISIILAILSVFFSFSFFSRLLDTGDDIVHEIEGVFEEETSDTFEEEPTEAFEEEPSDDILGKYVDVTFGEFTVADNGYYSETSLDVTVKNKADKRYTYYITIEAVDADGARIATDMLFADRLGAGQAIYLKAFEYIAQDEIDQFKHASFRVLEINKYDF